MQGMKTGNPIYQDDLQELARLDHEVTGVTTGMQAEAEGRAEAKLRQELQRATDLEVRLTSEVNRQTALAADAGPKLQRAAELTADLARLQTRYATVDDALRSLQLETSGPGAAHLASAANVPFAPVPSKSRIVLVLALPLALILGLAAAVLALRVDGRLYTADDVEETLGFAPVGILPRTEDGALMDEAFLRLAAGLEAARRRAGTRSFVFTAVSAHSSSDRVIEATERWLRRLGLLTRLLPAAALLGEVAGSLAASTGHGRRALAASGLNETETDAELLLIVAQPLLHSAEAEYAVRFSDAVILVVESGLTTRQELLAAAALLRRLGASDVGVLLQDVTATGTPTRTRETFLAQTNAVMRTSRSVSAGATTEEDRKAARVNFPSADRQSGLEAVSADESWVALGQFDRPEDLVEPEMAVSGAGKGLKE